MRAKLCLFLTLALLLGAQAPPAGAQAEEQPAACARYAYPGEEFSVDLPEAPAVFHTTRLVSRVPPYETDKVRVFGLYHRGVIFIIASFDNPRRSETLDRFPAIKDGREVSQQVLLEYSFNIY